MISAVPVSRPTEGVQNAGRIYRGVPAKRFLVLAAAISTLAAVAFFAPSSEPSSAPQTYSVPVVVEVRPIAVASTTTTSSTTLPPDVTPIAAPPLGGHLSIPSVGVDADWLNDDGTSGLGVANMETGLDSIHARPPCSHEHGMQIAGHRTTHTHPFLNLGQVVAGATINVSSGDQSCTYRVTGTRVVPAGEARFEQNRGVPGTLTLWTCSYDDGTPGGSDWRVVVDATLVD